MRRFAIIIAIIGLLVVGLFGLQLVASESGEVVVVTTRGSNAESISTRLWVVDLNGVAWLRSGSTKSAWYQRLLKNPEVEVRRGEETFTALSVAHEDRRQDINELMAAKYGWADQFIGLLFGRDTSIPIELVIEASED